MNKRQKLVFNSAAVDDLLARNDVSESEPIKATVSNLTAAKSKTLPKSATTSESASLLSSLALGLSENKASTSYNISDSLLLALDQACYELKAQGVRRNSTGRKVTRGHFVETAILHALKELQEKGMQSPFAKTLLDS